jgi:hypothetical protein
MRFAPNSNQVPRSKRLISALLVALLAIPFTSAQTAAAGQGAPLQSGQANPEHVPAAAAPPLHTPPIPAAVVAPHPTPASRVSQNPLPCWDLKPTDPIPYVIHHVRTAEADKWGDITVAQPKIWKFERVSALLDGLLRDVEGVSLGDLTQLDPSQQNGAALKFVQSALEVGVQYDQAAALNAANTISSYNALHASQLQQLDQYNNYMQTLTIERDRLAAQYAASSNEVNALQALNDAGTITPE